MRHACMVSRSIEEYVVVRQRHLHLKREYVNFHNSWRFEELGELYESTEMSRFVNTRLGTFYVHHRDLRTACLNMTDKGL